MQGKMIFYPNEQCLSYAQRVVTEIEKILKNPKKTIENSFLRKYISVLEKGQCNDFLKSVYRQIPIFKNGISSHDGNRTNYPPVHISAKRENEKEKTTALF